MPLSVAAELPSAVRAEARLPFALLAIVLGWAALLGLLAYQTGRDIEADAVQTREAAAHQAETLLPLFEGSVRRTLADTLRLLATLDLALRHAHDAAARADVLARFGAQADDVRLRVSLAAADGRVLASTAPLPAEPVSIADRDYFVRLSAADAPDWALGKPVQGRLAPGWTIPVAWRRSDAQGHFAGVLIAALDPGWLLRIAESFDLGRTGTIAVVDFDGTIYLRRDMAGTGVRAAAGTIGTTHPHLIVLAPARAAPVGRFGGVSALDGVRRLGHYRVLADYGLIVAYALGEDEVLARHVLRAARERRLALLAGGLLSAVAFGLFVWRLRDWRRARALLTAWRHAHTAARTDVLTGVGNRRGYEERLAALLATQAGLPSSLLYIDCDDFKRINDSAGHQAGDAVLRTLAQGCADSVRLSDYVARLGGDEFVVLLAGAGETAAAALAAKIKQRAETALAALGTPLTLSIGQLTFTAAASVETLTREVDAAMYRAKRAGKNRIVRVAAAGPD